MTKPILTVITPTTGKESLSKLIASIDSQSDAALVYHLLLWDDKRESNTTPESYNSANRHSIVCPPGTGRNGAAPGSMLRSIALMAAKTEWITFADDDVWWDSNHLVELQKSIENTHWASTLRTIWAPTGERLGVDRYESVGDDPGRRVPYEMCDGNTMICRCEFGVRAAYMYRETEEYNDDRLMYAFLKQTAGPRGCTNKPTINQICPEKLTEFFRRNCSPE